MVTGGGVVSGRLAGRAAIVTGAARGIGRAIVERLVGEGAAVTGLDRDSSVESLAAHLGPSARGVVVDLRNIEDTRAAVREAAEQMGGLWLLVNNAGIFDKTPLVEIEADAWREVMDVNALAPLMTMQAAASYLIAGGGGRIVNQASMAAKMGTAGEAAYAASKAAVVALSRIAAIEFGPHGITVNALCPGYVLTEMGADTRDDHQIAAWRSKSPLGRLATPEDVAGAVAFLASADGAYITGEAVNVSGGMCTW